jgi:hypothetical protein
VLPRRQSAQSIPGTESVTPAADCEALPHQNPRNPSLLPQASQRHHHCRRLGAISLSLQAFLVVIAAVIHERFVAVPLPAQSLLNDLASNKECERPKQPSQAHIKLSGKYSIILSP